jgi:ferric-dicitrate binding protein FerR (iron transport regulator)
MLSSPDSARTITLPDQSIVSLNRNSQISYNAGFINNRKLTLTGEAFFAVTPNTHHPFEILSDKTIIMVVGTSFNVKQNNNTTEVLVKTGKVSVSLNKMNVQLTRGEYAIADENEASIKKAKNTDINYLSWKTGKFEFNNLSLDKVAGFLTDHYNVPVKLGDSTLNKLSITASFDNQKLKNVLDVISLTFGLEQKWISGTCYLNNKK